MSQPYEHIVMSHELPEVFVNLSAVIKSASLMLIEPMIIPSVVLEHVQRPGFGEIRYVIPVASFFRGNHVGLLMCLFQDLLQYCRIPVPAVSDS